jgi:hypothetical protein
MIEFQKRGLPHVHMLLILDGQDNLNKSSEDNSGNDIDNTAISDGNSSKHSQKVIALAAAINKAVLA